MTLDQVRKILSNPLLPKNMPEEFNVDEEAVFLVDMLNNCEELNRYIFISFV